VSKKQLPKEEKTTQNNHKRQKRESDETKRDEEIGVRLAKFRSDRKLNQELFAEKIKINQGSLSRIERGLRRIDADFLYRVLQAYPKLNLEWLILGNGESGYEES
jgi:transcriptional regulator with XRE-family HTH domain